MLTDVRMSVVEAIVGLLLSRSWSVTMGILGWIVIAVGLFFAVIGLVRAMSPNPEADVAATLARMERRRRDTEVEAERAARRAADEVERDFP